MWSIIITVAMQILGWILGKVGASAETKKKYFEFIKLAANDTSSVKLMHWADEQLEEIERAVWLVNPVKKG